jgi:hypothetical protein
MKPWPHELVYDHRPRAIPGRGGGVPARRPGREHGDADRDREPPDRRGRPSRPSRRTAALRLAAPGRRSGRRSGREPGWGPGRGGVHAHARFPAHALPGERAGRCLPGSRPRQGRPPRRRRQRRPGGGRGVRGGLARPHPGLGRGVPPDAPVPARRAPAAQARARGDGQARRRDRPRSAGRMVRRVRPRGRRLTRRGSARGRGRAARLRRHHRLGGRRRAGLGRRPDPGRGRDGPARTRLHAPGAAWSRLRGCRDRGGQPGGAGRRGPGGGALHRPGQPHEQRPLPASRLPPGGGPRRALLHARAPRVTLHR